MECHLHQSWYWHKFLWSLPLSRWRDEAYIILLVTLPFDPKKKRSWALSLLVHLSFRFIIHLWDAEMMVALPSLQEIIFWYHCSLWTHHKMPGLGLVSSPLRSSHILAVSAYPAFVLSLGAKCRSKSFSSSSNWILSLSYFPYFLPIILSIPDWPRFVPQSFPLSMKRAWIDVGEVTTGWCSGKLLAQPEPCFSICEMVVRLTLQTSQAYYGAQMTWESTLKTELLYTYKALFYSFENSGSSFLSGALQY